MLAPDFVTNIKTLYPKLDWTEAGQRNLQNVVQLLTARQGGEGTSNEMWDEMESQLLNRLQYLNNYGGAFWRVQLSGDWGNKYNFGLQWFCEGRPSMNGLLQFNGIATVAPSVLVGEFTWWSIHT